MINLIWLLGEVCKRGKESVSDSVCKRVNKCKTLPKTIKNHQYPDICSFNRSEPIVCCPPKIEEINSLHIIKESTYTCNKIHWFSDDL